MTEQYFRSEQAVKLPTYHIPLPKWELRPLLEPEYAILDSGLFVRVKGIDDVTGDPEIGSKNWQLLRMLGDENCFAEYKSTGQYLLDTSARPPEDTVAVAATIWPTCDLYFLIIEYKKEENVSAVRQLAIQMTSVLHHNAVTRQ